MTSQKTKIKGHPIQKTLDKAFLNKPVFPQKMLRAKRGKTQKVSRNFQPVLNKKQYLEIINEITDPEVGVGIADLGLIYDVNETPEGLVEVEMTLTSMGCPAGGQIMGDIENILRLQAHVREVKINLVWDPPWKADLMNPDIKAMLWGNGGFNRLGL